MIRILLLYILPLLFPAAVYFLWVKLRGGAKDVEDGAEPRKDPWFWLILAGLGLMGCALALTALLGDATTSGTFQPDRLENGRVVPGSIAPKPR